jgi:hypothetical protein
MGVVPPYAAFALTALALDLRQSAVSWACHCGVSAVAWHGDRHARGRRCVRCISGQSNSATGGFRQSIN